MSRATWKLWSRCGKGRDSQLGVSLMRVCSANVCILGYSKAKVVARAAAPDTERKVKVQLGIFS